MVTVIDRGFARDACIPGVRLPLVREYVNASGGVSQYVIDAPAARVFLTPAEARMVYECLRELGADKANRHDSVFNRETEKIENRD